MSKVWPDCWRTFRKPLWCLSVSVLLKPTNELDIRQIWCHALSRRYWRIYQFYTLDYFTLFILSVDYILGWCFHGCLPVLSDLQVKEGAVVGKQNHTELTCSTSCSLSSNAQYVWYKNEHPVQDKTTASLPLDSSRPFEVNSYSCAVRGYEAHRSPAVCE